MPPKRRDQPWVGQETGSDNWYIYWYEPGSARVKRRSTGTRDRKEADAALGRFITARAEAPDITEPERFSPVLPPDRFAVETAIRHYLEQRASDLSAPETAGYCAQALLKHLTGTMVAHLTPAVWKRYERERGVKPATVRREQGFLRAAINRCVKDGLLTAAPDFDLAPMGAGRTRALDESEIEHLLAECREPHLRLFVMLALNTGARRGAILDLTWPQIDFVNGLINLNPADRIQTAKRRAVVPISDTLKDALRYSQETARSPYVVAYRGQPVAAIKTALGHACDRAGLKGVTSHTLRHTAGTLMAKAGVDLWKIAQLLGHSTAKTSELYAHFQPSWGREAVAVLGSITRSR
ncbi:MAG: site-specific integrase [Alphaproteobacteria bacterium]|nr:site-specific integrase [Alphaproteobacteria bacterium]